MRIPLTKPYWGKSEEQAAVAALRTGNGAGDGSFSRKFVTQMQKLTGAKYVFPVTSGTHGLELAMAALVLSRGCQSADEVILPSFTMCSTANCVVLAGLQPVFADIDAVTYNLDPDDLRRRITKKTRGIIPVHYAGIACPMERILVIARQYNLFVLEDAAHAIGAYYHGKMLGTWGDAGVYSFHGTKNLSCGEGGAVVTSDARLAALIDVYRANGTNRNAFLRGEVDKYSWIGKGSSYFLSDILASILVSQNNQINQINKKRQQIALVYLKQFKPYQNLVQLPVVPGGAEPNWHIFALKFKNERSSSYFSKKMRTAGIEVSNHYVSLHSSTMGKKIALSAYLPVTDDVAATLVRLPIYPSLKKSELGYIVRVAQKILEEFK